MKRNEKYDFIESKQYTFQEGKHCQSNKQYESLNAHSKPRGYVTDTIWKCHCHVNAHNPLESE